MTSTTRLSIKTYLQHWANSETNPKFAVLVEGRWGSGKTHFINQILADEEFTNKKRIYISLFGVNSLQEFERQLFYAATSTQTRLVHKGLGLAASVFSGAISVGSGGTVGGSASIEKVVEKTLQQVEKASKAINSSFIVIDDLERCGFDQSDFLGVINTHIEHGDARVVLVANSQKIENTKFAEFKEKVIGQTFELPPDPVSAIEVFTDAVNVGKTKLKIEEHAEQIKDLYQLSGYNNLRAVRQYIWLLSTLLEAMEDEYFDNSELVKSLITQSFVFFMEFKQNLSDEASALTPDDLVSEIHSDDPKTRSFFEWKANKDDPDTPRRKVVIKYNLFIGIQSVITLKQWISILSTGIVDEHLFNAELGGASEVLGSDTWPSWKRLWHIFDWDFSDGSVEVFDSDVADVLVGIEDGRYLDPPVFMHVVGVILLLVDERIIEDVKGGWGLRFKRYIDNFIIPSLELGKFSSTRWSYDTGYDGLGYMSRDEEDFKQVLDHLQTSGSNWYSTWKQQSVAEYLLTNLRTNYLDFLGDLTIINGRGKQRFLREPILHVIPISDFLRTWLSLSRERERGLVDSFGDRYDYCPESLLSEGPWWLDLKRAIEAKALSEPIRPRAVQLRHLANQIGKVVEERLEKERLKQSTCEPIQE